MGLAFFFAAAVWSFSDDLPTRSCVFKFFVCKSSDRDTSAALFLTVVDLSQPLSPTGPEVSPSAMQEAHHAHHTNIDAPISIGLFCTKQAIACLAGLARRE
jgi:hypothetical protein